MHPNRTENEIGVSCRFAPFVTLSSLMKGENSWKGRDWASEEVIEAKVGGIENREKQGERSK